MRRLDDTGQNYIPLRLPCGKEINQHYIPGKTMQCCRTECPEKSDAVIEECYKRHKQRLIEKAEESGKVAGIINRKRKRIKKEKGAA